MMFLVFICVTMFLFCVDVIIKTGVESGLRTDEERTFYKKKLRIRKVYNQGMSMNLLENSPETVHQISLFMAITVTICQLFTLLRKGKWMKKTGLSLITAGAWGNTFDRFIRGYVIDYMGLNREKAKGCMFNLADVWLIAGTIIVILSTLLKETGKIFRRKKT